MKKLVALILAIVLVSTVFVASAAKDDKVTKEVEKANAKIEKIVEKAQKSEKDDAAKAQTKTDKVAEKAKEKVAKMGGEVECILTEEEIDGNLCMIDPLIVINPHVVKK